MAQCEGAQFSPQAGMTQSHRVLSQTPAVMLKPGAGRCEAEGSHALRGHQPVVLQSPSSAPVPPGGPGDLDLQSWQSSGELVPSRPGVCPGRQEV